MKVNASLDFIAANGKRHMSFQLEENGQAVAVVDIEDGMITRIILDGELKTRRVSIEKLAIIHYEKNAKEGLTKRYSSVK